MTDTILVGVHVPFVGDERRKNWAKVVEFVDPSKPSGWAFEGDFIAAGGIQDVPVGSVVVVYGEKGSRDNPQIEARVFTANADATLTLHTAARGKAWARTIRDHVADLLAEPHEPSRKGWESDLMLYEDDALAEELTRRGWSVQRGAPS